MHGPLKVLPEKAIIQKYKEGTSIKALAAEYRISQNTIRKSAESSAERLLRGTTSRIDIGDLRPPGTRSQLSRMEKIRRLTKLEYH